MKRTRSKYLPPLIALIVIIAALELITKGFGIEPTILPPPSKIFNALIRRFVDNLLAHTINTIGVIIAGFAIGVPLGFVLAAILSQFISLTKMLTPYIIVLSITPMLTLIPLFKLWFGFGNWVKIVIIVVQIIPIIALNSITGFQSVTSEKKELMEVYGATKWESFWKVTFPNALPFIFTGMRLGSIFATIATISCELNGFTEGLGTRVIYYSKYLETDTVYAVIIIIAVVGYTLFSLVNYAESKIITWKVE